MTRINMSRARRLTWISAFSLVAVIATGCVASDEPLGSQELSAHSLHQVLKNGTRAEIFEALNRVKQFQHNKELLSSVVQLWTGSGRAVADIPQDKLRDGVIRLNVADILIQAQANGYLGIDVSEMRRYARSLIDSADEDEAMAAASAISRPTDPEDIDALSRAMRDRRDPVFRSAVLSLSFGCNDRTRAVIDQYLDEVADEHRRAFLLKLQKDRAKPAFCGH